MWDTEKKPRVVSLKRYRVWCDTMKEWDISDITVRLQLGPVDDSNMDIVVKTRNISLGMAPPGTPLEAGSITVEEESFAETCIYWPPIALSDEDRRKRIFEAVDNALAEAVSVDAKDIGLFTMGLEVARIPSWEIAEEIVKAVLAHGKKQSPIHTINLIASTPTQVSSFEFALNNWPILP
ncbi:MAG: hypothetical protein BAJATHORv1_80006 [Candidatus Thorarchaeota archaeon]|nr:MAG: hypothetical protein BAJATHORv1_80006 [Candidatus Thorarchaeota archaeon]